MSRITAPELQKKKASGERIAMVTAYDAAQARLVDAAGADMVLVGDSLGMVVQGQPDTLGVTVWNKSGGLWFSSSWSGTRTVEQSLAGGNLVVR